MHTNVHKTMHRCNHAINAPHNSLSERWQASLLQVQGGDKTKVASFVANLDVCLARQQAPAALWTRELLPVKACHWPELFVT